MTHASQAARTSSADGSTRAAPGPERELLELDEEQCRQLLSTAVIGRIAFTDRALPAIQPVRFALLGDHVVIPTRPGSKIAAASRHAVAAFEVDDFDVADRTGWSVTVVGASRIVTDRDEAASLDALGLLPWAPTDQLVYIAIKPRIWHGRRIRLVADRPVATR